MVEGISLQIKRGSHRHLLPESDTHRFEVEEGAKERSYLPVARMTDMASGLVLVRLIGHAAPI